MTFENLTEPEFDFPHISEVVMAGERLIFNTTEDILLAMQDAGMTQSDLAKKMGKSKSFISQILDGRRNLTLKTLSDIAFALNLDVRLNLFKDGRDVSHPIIPEREYYESNFSNIEPSVTPTFKIIINNDTLDYERYVAC
ncbi:helix-turn-helix domain-containing protein [Pantoea stewartii]|uniref:helix-turn-helix domain-containing protein n=1 Tax=Pantoea stewartii TaxID=66269 RepID=UPI00197E0AEF|nr:helix-turn-helix transcriptional regulator [Pantoea stewartii]